MEDSVFEILFGFLATFGVIFLGIYIFLIIINWKMFEKAGKPAWAAIVPFYNFVVMLEIAGYKWYYIFFAFLNMIPVVGSILFVLFSVSYSIKLAKSFGQTTGFGIGLWLVNPIFTAIIAFSKDIKYVGPSVNGDIDFNDLF